jgi:ribonuclease BN (tRNA processing enzyme)
LAEIVVLGSGSGPPHTQDRFFTSIILMVNSSCYLLDCGEPASALMFRNGIDSFSTRAVFISHLHPDHIGGLAGLLSSMNFVRRSSSKKFKAWSITRYDDWYRDAIRFPEQVVEEDKDAKLDLFIPSEGVEGIKTYLNTVYLFPELMPFALDVSPVENGLFYTDENIKVSASPNLHMKNNFRYEKLRDTHSKIQMQSYSFMIEVEGKKIVFSGDIDSLEELTPFMDGADILMVEIAHYDPEGIKPFVDRYAPEQVILIHIHPGLEERIAKLVEEWDDPRISIAEDGYSLTI